MLNRLIYDINDYNCNSICDNNSLTAIIPAAGKGSRLGYNKPKILYPLLGRPLIFWLVNSIKEVTENFVFILSPSGCNEVISVLNGIIPNKFDVVIQNNPTGMADAILLSNLKVHTDNSLVIWGDQVCVSSKTLKYCIHLHNSSNNILLTLPTIIKNNPYVQIIRNNEDKVISIMLNRELEKLSPDGENDCGIFIFKSKEMFEILKYSKDRSIGVGGNTHEFNLLPLLPFFDDGLGSLRTLRIHDDIESIGINSLEDVNFLESILKQRNKYGIK